MSRKYEWYVVVLEMYERRYKDHWPITARRRTLEAAKKVESFDKAPALWPRANWEGSKPLAKTKLRNEYLKEHDALMPGQIYGLNKKKP